MPFVYFIFSKSLIRQTWLLTSTLGDDESMSHKYYYKFKTILSLYGLVYIATITFLAYRDILHGESINGIIFVIIFSLILGALIGPLFTWGVIRIFPVYVNKDGLRSYNCYGFYKTISWHEIETIQPINIIGFKYIRVKSKLGGLPIWVPIWINDVKGFLDRIDYCGGDKILFQKYFDRKNS